MHLPISDWFGSKRTFGWIQINRKRVYTIWFRVDLTRFRKKILGDTTLKAVTPKHKTGFTKPNNNFRISNASMNILTITCTFQMYKFHDKKWTHHLTASLYASLPARIEARVCQSQQITSGSYMATSLPGVLWLWLEDNFMQRGISIKRDSHYVKL